MPDPLPTRPESLTMSSGGRWAVRTRDSVHYLDLDQLTATRVPGPTANTFTEVVAKPLLSIAICQVGEPGRWEIDATDNSQFDYFWVLTSRILKIERAGDGEELPPRTA